MTYLATQGAKKEGIWGLVKGTGKGVLGLVLRPTGGLIDLTSATFNAVQRCVWGGGCAMKKTENDSLMVNHAGRQRSVIMMLRSSGLQGSLDSQK